MHTDLKHLTALAASVAGGLIAAEPGADPDALVDCALDIAARIVRRAEQRHAPDAEPTRKRGGAERAADAVLRLLASSTSLVRFVDIRRSLTARTQCVWNACALLRELGLAEDVRDGRSSLGWRLTAEGRLQAGASGAFAAVAGTSTPPGALSGP